MWLWVNTLLSCEAVVLEDLRDGDDRADRWKRESVRRWEIGKIRWIGSIEQLTHAKRRKHDLVVVLHIPLQITRTNTEIRSAKRQDRITNAKRSSNDLRNFSRNTKILNPFFRSTKSTNGSLIKMARWINVAKIGISFWNRFRKQDRRGIDEIPSQDWRRKRAASCW